MALLAIIGVVIQPVSKYVLVPIKQQASNFICYKKYVHNLKREAEKLEPGKNDVRGRVQVAQRNSEVVLDDVERWLSSVEDIIKDAQRLENQLQGNIRCFDLRMRYKLGKEAKIKIGTVNDLQRDGNFISVSYPNPNIGIESLPDGDFYKSESTELAMKQVMDAVKDEDKNIIGVYGMGGVGKTTLVKQVAKLVKNESLYEEVVMVLLSKNPDHKGIQDDIAKQLGMHLEDGSILIRACQLSKRLNQSIQMRACELSKRLNPPKNVLIILDNLWERLDLVELGIPLGKKHMGCKIIITTRDMEICDIMESPAKIEVKVLPEQESWRLFREKAGDIVDTPPLHDLAREVAEECGGLPLAIVTLGRALRNKVDEPIWKNALRELRRLNPVNIKDMTKVFTSLEMSYNFLESEEAKSLFLLCSLFEEGYHISINDLIRYGMGEGLFSNVNTLEEASEKVHTLILKLKSSCLLLEGEGDNRVKMHDLVHKAAISIASRHEHGFFVKVGIGLEEWPEIENLKKCKRISFAKNNLEMLPDSVVCPQLLTLNIENNDSLRRIPKSFFTGMKVLRVLNLCTTNISSLPLSMEFLVNLRTLWLDRCRELKDVAVIGKLKKLEMLCLKQSGVNKLPKEIGELTNLKLLDLSQTKLEIVPPNVISRLTRLEELYMGDSFNQWEPEGAEESFSPWESEGAEESFSPWESEGAEESFSERESEGAEESFSQREPEGAEESFSQREPEGAEESFSQRESEEPEGAEESFSQREPEGAEESFSQREPEGAEDARQASIAEFEFLKHLRVLDVHIKTLSCMPQNSTSGPWKNLMKFQICIGRRYLYSDKKRSIAVQNISFPIPYSVQSLFDITNTLFFVRCRGLTNLADRQELRGESLKKLVISDCGEMECVISMEEKAPPLKFKSLKSLYLSSLENLKTICNGPLAAACLENLRLLLVRVGSNLLINILPSHLLQVLQNLEWLYVADCQELQEVFNSEGLVEQHALLTNLITLHLKNLPSLSSIWKGAMPIGSLRDLWKLIVVDCGLRYIFSPAFPQFAAQLGDLRIKDCEKMENLIMEENFPSQSPAIGCFQNLKVLFIHKCHGFKSLFSSSSARELECLEILEVHSCDGMEVIIRKGEEVAGKGVLPRLGFLTLSCLPKLTDFYEEVRILNFDSLKLIGLWSCPELKWVPLGPQSAPDLKWVCSSGWTELEKLEWNDESVKSRLENLFIRRSMDSLGRDPFK